VIATDKKLSSTLVDTDQVNKVEGVTEGAGFVYSGLGPDYRVLGEFVYLCVIGCFIGCCFAR